eukprot:TRINITY_DN5256_c0_g1_i1.p1 TRINITY_DN5256_c0_g1~~TRINITY_DN5256_c0_g1_i1.p1  ORF type:complete len:566 (-),score=165.96 TRINITY_DN5256_c0_g1_i1:149-1846(-)
MLDTSSHNSNPKIGTDMKALIVLLALAAAFAATSQSKFNAEEALRFLNRRLSDISTKLEVRQKEDGTFGIFAKEDLEFLEPLMRISKDNILTAFDNYPRSYFFWEMVTGAPSMRLAGRFLFEKFVHTRGFWVEYFRRINPAWFEDSVYLWNDQQWDAYGARLGYTQQDSLNKKNIDQEINKTIELNLPYLADYEPKFPPEMFDELELRRALAHVNAASVPLRKYEYFVLNEIQIGEWERKIEGYIGKQEGLQNDEDGLAFIPFIDLLGIEHTPLNSSYKVSERLNVSKAETKRLLEFYNISTDEVYNLGDSFSEFKLYDHMILEHGFPFDLRNFLVPRPGQFILYANRAYKAGEELRYSRGRYSNAVALQNFGSVDPNNNFEAMTFFIAPSIFQMPEEYKNLTVNLGLAANGTIYKFFLTRNQQPHRLIDFMRLVAANYSFNTYNATLNQRVLSRGRFNSPWIEVWVWKNIVWQLMAYPSAWKSTLKQDRADLASGKLSKLETLFVENGILTKEILLRHLNNALYRFTAVYHNDIMQKELKKHILDMAKCQTCTNIRLGIVTYDE